MNTDAIRERIAATAKPLDTSIEKRQAKLQANNEARERCMTKLFRLVTQMRKLEQERKRLLGPNRKGGPIKYRKLEDIPRMAGGGDEFNDDIPL